MKEGDQKPAAAANGVAVTLERTVLTGLLADARKAAGLFHLPLRQQRWRGLSGDRAGMGVGSSLEFQDHRAYLPGDDPRQINWQAYARTGHYTMKQYREEVRPVVDLILDASESMFAFPEKAMRAVGLWYFAMESALRHGASIRAVAARGAAHRVLDIDAVLTHRWWDELAGWTAREPNEPSVLPRLPLRPGSLRVWVTDLLFPAAPEPLLAALASRNGRAVVLAPFCADEAEPDWQGNYEFVDAESHTLHLRKVEPALQERYQAAYARHFAWWKGAARKYGIPLARVAAEGPLIDALQAEAVPDGALEL